MAPKSGQPNTSVLVHIPSSNKWKNIPTASAIHARRRRPRRVARRMTTVTTEGTSNE
jgi:hypothetical protein